MSQPFNIKLQSIIIYICNMITGCESTPPTYDTIKFKHYSEIKKIFNRQSFGRTQRLFYKLYKQSLMNYTNVILKLFEESNQGYRYNHYAVATNMLNYASTYQKNIVDQFFNIITQ